MNSVRTAPRVQRPVLMLTALLGGMFLGNVDIAVVNVAIPSIRENLRTSAADLFTDTGDATEVGEGDILLIPAWSVHHFENHTVQDLVLLNMSNQPQQAGLHNFRVEAEGDR